MLLLLLLLEINGSIRKHVHNPSFQPQNDESDIINDKFKSKRLLETISQTHVWHQILVAPP